MSRFYLKNPNPLKSNKLKKKMLKKERSYSKIHTSQVWERKRERIEKNKRGTERQENRNRAKEREQHFFFIFRDNFSYCGARQKWSRHKKIDEDSWPVLYPFRTFIVKMGLIKLGQGVGLPFTGLNLSIATSKSTWNKKQNKQKQSSTLAARTNFSK